MREATFLKQNADRWKRFEGMLADRRADPDQLADLFVELTDDLSYARTFYPDSKTTQYLNNLTRAVHQEIYKNKKERAGRIVEFWKTELPLVFARSRREMIYSFVIFMLAASIGALSAANDDSFVRLILGDAYVNMTEENIAKGDPMAVYKQESEFEMFMMIPLNNIKVSFLTFAAGILASFGTGYLLFYNGIMIGSFQYFFYEKGLLLPSAMTIWIHGTIEISSIVIAGAAGLALGNGLLFPGTYSRKESFVRGAVRGMKIVVGLVPFLLIAGFLESYVTRHTEMPVAVSGAIIVGSLAFVVWYFIVYPLQVERTVNANPRQL